MKNNETEALIQSFQEQFRRIHHLDRVALTNLAIITPLILVLLAFYGLVILKSPEEALAISLVALALAAAGAHGLVANTCDYWITFCVLSQHIQGLGLVQRGVFPSSLLSHPPTNFWQLLRRAGGGFRGALMAIYLAMGWLNSFLILGIWLEGIARFGLAFLPPFALFFVSLLNSYFRLRYALRTLLIHQQLQVASKAELVARHCDLAEALLQLDPPRIYFATVQYQLALEIEPDNPRARQGLQRLTSLECK